MPKDTLNDTFNTFAELVDWSARRDEELQHAALLLGGRAALARTQRLLATLRMATKATTRLERELDALMSLLALDAVHDVESDEAECFAAISPSDPVVADICVLTDELRALLDRQADAQRAERLAAFE